VRIEILLAKQLTALVGRHGAIDASRLVGLRAHTNLSDTLWVALNADKAPRFRAVINVTGPIWKQTRSKPEPFLKFADHRWRQRREVRRFDAARRALRRDCVEYDS
jgi:hypothetical protein